MASNLRMSAKAAVEARLSLNTQAKELIQIREQLKELEARKKVIAESLLTAVIDNDGKPLSLDNFDLSVVCPAPRRVLDERLLLEHGVKLQTIEDCKVSKPSSPWCMVKERKE